MSRACFGHRIYAAWVASLAILLFVLSAAPVLAVRMNPRDCSVESSELALSWPRHTSAPIVTYRGIRIFQGGYGKVRSKNYAERYFNARQKHDPGVQVTSEKTTVDGNPACRIVFEIPEHELTATYQGVLESADTFRIEWITESDKLDNAYMEFCPVILAPEPSMGRMVQMRGGERDANFLLPLKPRTHDRRFFELGDPKKLTIYSRAAKMTVTALGSLPGLEMLDFRASQFAKGAHQRAFHLYRRFRVPRGRHRFGVRVTFEPPEPGPMPDDAMLSDAGMTPRTAGPQRNERLILPRPQRALWGDGTVSVAETPTVWMSRKTADALKERLEALPLNLKADLAASDALTGWSIALSASPPDTVPERRELSAGLADWARREAYQLDISAAGAVIQATHADGAWNGWLSLVQLVDAGDPGKLPAGTIVDWPALRFRGYLITPRNVYPRDDFLRALLTTMAKLKYNHFCLQFKGDVQLEAHPEGVHPTRSYTKEQIRSVIALGKRLGVTVFPEIKAIGHTEWAHGGGPRGRPLDQYPHLKDWFDPEGESFNPTSRAAMRMLKSYLDAMIALFDNPPYVHISGDEAHHWATSPEAKNKDAARLLADWIIELHEHVKSHGADTLLYGDMLLSKEDYPQYTAAHSLRGTERAVDMLPTDIIIADWHYHDDAEFPSARMFQQKGFRVIGLPWNSIDGIHSWGRQLSQDNNLGIMGTSWFQIRSSFPGLAATAEAAWNPDEAPESFETRDGGAIAMAWTERNLGPSPDNAGDYVPLDLTPHANVGIRDAHAADGTGWLDYGPLRDLRALPTGSNVRLRGIPFHISQGKHQALMLYAPLPPCNELPRSVRGIEIGQRVKRLHILQACSFSEDYGETVMTCRLQYRNGDSENVPVRYKRETDIWLPELELTLYKPAPSCTLIRAWRGRTLDGSYAAVMDLSVDTDAKRILESVDIVGHGTRAAPFVFGITLEKP